MPSFKHSSLADKTFARLILCQIMQYRVILETCAAQRLWEIHSTSLQFKATSPRGFQFYRFFSTIQIAKGGNKSNRHHLGETPLLKKSILLLDPIHITLYSVEKFAEEKSQQDASELFRDPSYSQLCNRPLQGCCN